MAGACEIHPRLVADTKPIAKLGLSHLLLMNDERFPWLILVPDRQDLTEIHQLDRDDLQMLIDEIARVSEAASKAFKPDKINVGALGNIVSQLHVHVVARFRGDAAWPGPVWGSGSAIPYGSGQGELVVARLLAELKELDES